MGCGVGDPPNTKTLKKKKKILGAEMAKNKREVFCFKRLSKAKYGNSL
jgi:hypothetical protein